MSPRSFSSLQVIAVLAAAGFCRQAHAECKDLVLRMQDTSGKTAGREITMFLNCHEGSYLIPSSSTINVFEWKGGRLCHGHRVCGNAKYWNGHFGVGGVWAWGNSLTDFTSNTRIVNHFKKLADGSPAGRGGDATSVANSSPSSNQVCVNSSDQDVNIYRLSSINSRNSNGPVSADGTATGNGGNATNLQLANAATDQDALCVDKLQVNAIWNNRNIRIYGSEYPTVGSAVGGVLGDGVRDQMEDELGKDGRWMCFQKSDIGQTLNSRANGGQGPVANGGAAIGGYNYSPITDIFTAGNLQTTQTCARDVASQISAPATAIAVGGQGGNGYSPVFGRKSGTSSTSGSIDTDYNDHALQVDFALDFGQIERYCTPIREESCF
ncbi:MAG: hypothetical protein RI953_1455 [Pseudomonadota bacterium]|jgi:hypothetical protein